MRKEHDVDNDGTVKEKISGLPDKNDGSTNAYDESDYIFLDL